MAISNPDFSETPPRPRIAITLGDPAGIGPEVILKALAAKPWGELADITVVGNWKWLAHHHQVVITSLGNEALIPLPVDLSVYEVLLPDTPQQPLQLGQGNATTGAMGFAYLKTAITETLAGKFDAIVTGPIAKSAWKAAGHLYPGQTELLADESNAHRYGMAFVGKSPHTGWVLRTLLATTHIPLNQVSNLLTWELMSQKLELLIDWLQQDWQIAQPRIAISGLNPHSGEQGQLGHEESEWITPWLEEQRSLYPQVELTGLVPPDTLWVLPGQAWYGTHETAPQRAHDAYLALYHDQGLIPVKLMAFDRAVNTTIGLPFVRTSPDHGTAFDIAGKGVADATSMVAAIGLAIDLVRRRQQ